MKRLKPICVGPLNDLKLFIDHLQNVTKDKELSYPPCKFIDIQKYENILKKNIDIKFFPYYLVEIREAFDISFKHDFPLELLNSLKLPPNITAQFEKEVLNNPPFVFSENLEFGIQDYAKARLIFFLVPRDKGRINRGLMHVNRSDVHVLYDELIDMSDQKETYTNIFLAELFHMQNEAIKRNISQYMVSLKTDKKIDISDIGDHYSIRFANIMRQHRLTKELIFENVKLEKSKNYIYSSALINANFPVKGLWLLWRLDKVVNKNYDLRLKMYNEALKPSKMKEKINIQTTPEFVNISEIIKDFLK